MTKKEHGIFTNVWKNKIPYGTNATAKQVKQAAKEIYKDYPETLKNRNMKIIMCFIKWLCDTKIVELTTNSASNESIETMENETIGFFREHLPEIDGYTFWVKCKNEFPYRLKTE